MEINDYLAIAKRRWIILLGVPLLAAIIVAIVLNAAPTTYRAVATVNAPALVGGSSGQYTGSQAVNQFVSAFQSTASTAPVDDAVFKATSLQQGEIESGLAVEQVGGSSAITVTFVGDKKGESAQVVSTVASATLSQMFDSQVTLATTRVDEAAKQVAAGNAAINAWGDKNGMVDPNRVYQARLERLNSLQQTQASFKAQGNDVAAAALSGTITSVTNSLVEFGPKIAAYNDLVSARDAAQSDLTSARQALSQATSQKAAADPKQVVWVSSERPVDPMADLASIGLPVVGAGLFLAIALIAVLELLRSNRRARQRRGADAGGEARVADERVEPAERVEAVDPASGGHADESSSVSGRRGRHEAGHDAADPSLITATERS